MKIILEIRAAEGGEDSKLFIKDLAQSYIKMFERVSWKYNIIDFKTNEIFISVEGDNLTKLFNECGGHRIQRIPPTEKKGRVHTSTVTVAVLEEQSFFLEIKDSDLKIEWYSGTGSGGQHRNKHQNSCRMTHVPTGITVTSQCRSRQNSYKECRTTIENIIKTNLQKKFEQEISLDRKYKVGSGMRGDKVWTYRFQDDIVQDHNTNKKSTCKKVLNGNFELLW